MRRHHCTRMRATRRASVRLCPEARQHRANRRSRACNNRWPWLIPAPTDHHTQQLSQLELHSYIHTYNTLELKTRLICIVFHTFKKYVMQAKWHSRPQRRLAKNDYFTLCKELCRAWLGTLRTGPYRLSGKQGSLLCDRPMVCAEQVLIRAMHCEL